MSLIIPKVAFFCHDCNELHLWNGSDEKMELMLGDMRESELIPCPMCGDLQEIDAQTRMALSDTP